MTAEILSRGTNPLGILEAKTMALDWALMPGSNPCIPRCRVQCLVDQLQVTWVNLLSAVFSTEGFTGVAMILRCLLRSFCDCHVSAFPSLDKSAKARRYSYLLITDPGTNIS